MQATSAKDTLHNQLCLKDQSKVYKKILIETKREKRKKKHTHMCTGQNHTITKPQTHTVSIAE